MNPSLDKANFIIQFASHNLNSHKNTSFLLTVAPQKAIKSKLFLELVTCDRKMPKFRTFFN